VHLRRSGGAGPALLREVLLMATQAGLFGDVGQVGATAAPAGPLWFVRCCDCLSVVAVTAAELPRRVGRDGFPICGACGGPVELMGQVERARLVSVAHLAPCDERCTNARGPSCDCKCGGRNHGSKLVVRVVRDRGPVPVVAVRPSGQLVMLAAEFRTARDAAYQAADELPGRAIVDRARGAWLPPADFAAAERWRSTRRRVVEACRLRVHRTRVERLRAIAAEVRRAVAS
jgi:hypothetical protein